MVIFDTAALNRQHRAFLSRAFEAATDPNLSNAEKVDALRKINLELIRAPFPTYTVGVPEIHGAAEAQ